MASIPAAFPAPKPPATGAELRQELERAAREAGALRTLFGAALARRLGINPTDLECLDIVASHIEVCAGDLAALTGLTSGAVTGVIDRLERRGLARRERDAVDRRRVLVRPTAAAAVATAAYAEPLGETAGGLGRHYGEPELSLLLGYFTRMRAAILAELGRLAEPDAP